MWKALQEGSVLNIFQFDSDVGSQAAKKIKPTNIMEMADANGLMRLMTAEKGAETPMEKYIRYKNNLSLSLISLNIFLPIPLPLKLGLIANVWIEAVS